MGGQWIEQVLPDYNFNIYFQLTKDNIEVLTKNETTDMNCIGYTWRGSAATYPQSKCILWSKTPDLGKFEEETPENEFEKADLVNGAYVYRGYAAPPETTSDVNFDRNNPSSRFCSLDNNQCDYNTGTNTCINIDWPTSAQCNAFDWNSDVHYAGPGYVPIQIEQMNANVDSWRVHDFGYTEGQRTRTYLKIQPRGDWVTRRCGYANEDVAPTTSYNLVSIPTSDTSVYHESVFPDGISQSNVYKIVIPYKTEDENGENKIDTDRFHTTEINFFADYSVSDDTDYIENGHDHLKHYAILSETLKTSCPAGLHPLTAGQLNYPTSMITPGYFRNPSKRVTCTGFFRKKRIGVSNQYENYGLWDGKIGNSIYTKDGQDYSQCSHCEDHEIVSPGRAATSLSSTKEDCVKEKFMGIVGSESGLTETTGHWKFFNVLVGDQNQRNMGRAFNPSSGLHISWSNERDPHFLLHR